MSTGNPARSTHAPPSPPCRPHLADSTPAYKNRIKSDIESAEKYLKRKPRRHEGEMGTVLRAIAPLSDVRSVLDIPCGVGRATMLLASRGYETVGADLGEGAVSVARREVRTAGLDSRIERQDLEQMPYPDRGFDAILCFRMYHHFPDDPTRQRVIGELCRVAQRYVLISYLNPWSLTSIRRRVRAALGGKRSRQYTTRLSDLDRFFAAHGFTRVADEPIRRFLNSLHLAVYRRDELYRT